MPIPNTATADTRLRSKHLPFLDKTEWIEMLTERNFIDDFNAEVRAQHQIEGLADTTDVEEDEVHREGRVLEEGEQDPDVLELEDVAENKDKSAMDISEGERWFGIFQYMCPRFKLFMEPTKEELAEGQTLGRRLDDKSYKDRRYIFGKIGKYLVPLLYERDGGTFTTPNKDAKGKQISFPKGDGVDVPEGKAQVSTT